MKDKGIGRGVVCDEYGIFQGIITLKEIMDGLIGDTSTENKSPDILERKDNNGWLVSGQCPFHDFLIYFDMDTLYSSFPYKTLSGLLLELLGHIPKAGETVTWKDFDFEILDMEKARIDKVLVTKMIPEKTQASPESEEEPPEEGN